MDPNLLMFAQMAAPGGSKLLANLRGGQRAGPPMQPMQLPPGLAQAGGGAAPPGMPPPQPPPGDVNVNVGLPPDMGDTGMPPGMPGMPPGGPMGPMGPGGPGGPPPGPQAGQSAIPPPQAPTPLQQAGIGSQATPQFPPGMMPQGQPPISAEKALAMLAQARQGAANPMAAMGRNGDDRMAHVAPGDMVVPPEIQAMNPDITRALAQAFMNAGADPGSRTVGHPNANINPQTGQEEFGFDISSMLPMILAVGASALGAPYLAPVIEGLGVGGTTAGVLASGLAGGLGSTAGNLINGMPLGPALGQGLLSGAGSAAGGYLLGGANPAAGGGILGNLFGTGPTPAATIPGLSATAPPTGWAPGANGIFTNLQTGATSDIPGIVPPQTGWAPGANGVFTNLQTGETTDVPGVKMPGNAKLAAGTGQDGGFLTSLGGVKGLLGSALGGSIGSALGADLFGTGQKQTDAANLGPHLGPAPPYTNYITGRPTVPTRALTPEELRLYGRGGGINYFG